MFRIRDILVRIRIRSRIRTFHKRIRILLFSSLTFKTLTKNKYLFNHRKVEIKVFLFMDLDPYLRLTNLDPGGPKTGSGTLPKRWKISISLVNGAKKETKDQ